MPNITARSWLSSVPERPMAVETGWQAAQGHALTGLPRTSARSWEGSREKATSVVEAALTSSNHRS